MNAPVVAQADSNQVPASGTRAFAAFEWMLALRYLRSRRANGFVSVIAGFSFLGIMLGVATLIVVMSVMNGFHIELMSKIIGINGHVFMQGADTPLTDYDEVIERVSKVPGVKVALPMVESAAGVSSPYQQSGALVRGIREKDIKQLPGIAGNVKLGTLDNFDTSEGVAIGQKLAENLSVRVGDKVSILTARGAQTPFGVGPRKRNRSFFEALKVERTVMFFILTLIVIVAALNIISGLTMLVKDKGRAIAILRTMGATRGAILRVFLITGSAIGIVGTLAGFLLGLLVAHNLEAIRLGLNAMFNLNIFDPTYYFLSRLPSVVVPSDVITIVTLSLSLSLLATILPSWSAAKTDPVEALRYE